MNENSNIPAHGGDLVSASKRYNIAIEQWIDLSTGINPVSYPVNLDSSCFQQLPYIRREFIEASSDYYQCADFISVTGTQAAIQQIPELLADLPVLLPKIGYQEHAKYWQQKTTNITYYDSDTQALALSQINRALDTNAEQHIVIINPNNPTGVLFSKDQLLNWAEKLADRAYLIIDEAFIDLEKQHSVLSNSLPENIIVLRSFGKFFGLAGVRLGYCFANKVILNKLQSKLGLWQVNGPAQALAINALKDKEWQANASMEILSNNRFMQKLWQPVFIDNEINKSGNKNSSAGSAIKIAEKYHSPLFLSYKISLDNALLIQDYFAKLGVLLRVITMDSNNDSTANVQGLLRIGLLDQHNTELVERLARVIESFLHYRYNENNPVNNKANTL